MSLLGTITTTVVSTAVIAAAVTAIIGKMNNDKNQSLKYITEERAKWREFVKVSASKIYSGKYDKTKETQKSVITHLMLSLNPLKYTSDNKLDNRIRELLEEIESGNRRPEILKEFRYCIGTLLKHDWERSKNEAKPWYKQDLDDTIKRRFLHIFYLEKHERKKEEQEFE